MDTDRFAGLSATPVYNIKALSQATGIPPATVRAWERRYGAVASARTPTGRRLYSERDIAALRWLHDRLQEGLSIARAVDLLRQPVSASAAAVQAEKPLALGALEDVQARLLDAVRLLDAPAAERILTEALAVYSPGAVLDQIVTPLLRQVGDLWERGGISVTCEHMVSSLAAAQVSRLIAATGPPVPGPPVLVGAAPDDLHDFGALLLALQLRWRRIPVLFLGARLPLSGLAADLRRLRPAALCLSAAMPESVQRIQEVAALLNELPPPRPLLACGGYAFLRFPTLREAVGDAYLAGSAAEGADRLAALLRSGTVPPAAR